MRITGWKPLGPPLTEPVTGPFTAEMERKARLAAIHEAAIPEGIEPAALFEDDGGFHRLARARAPNKGYFHIFNTGAATLNADYNYWDDACVAAAWFYGPVDYPPWTDSSHSEVLSECTGVPDFDGDRPYASRNFPNPFNPSTAIRYAVPETGARVTLTVYDLSGRLVRTLIDEDRAAGEHSVVWFGRDDRGNELASGVYFYRVRIGGYSAERKMLLLK